MNTKTYFYQCSHHLQNIQIKADENHIPNPFAFLNDIKFDYKSILNIQFIEKFDETKESLYHFTKIHESNHSIDSLQNITITNLNEILFEKSTSHHNTSINIKILASLSTPEIASNLTPEERTNRGVQRSEILFIYIIITPQNFTITSSTSLPSIYESYGPLGFFATDKKIFNEFIVSKIGAGKHDLVQYFTTTEIANELFDAGLMVLCWGITPWVYFVSSKKANKDFCDIVENTPIIKSGHYKLSNDIETIEIIPSNELREWNTNTQKSWPSLKLTGEGNGVQLDLHVAQAINPYHRDVPDYFPLPFFRIQRTEFVEKNFNPILHANIEDDPPLDL